MKKLITLFLAVVISSNIHAKVWRVNNMKDVNCDFTNFTAAQNAASDNDTLYIESSTVSYGSIIITKPLTLIGTGYFLEENPHTQAIKVPSVFESITFKDNSSGSVITGLTVNNHITISTSRISLIRCLIGYIKLDNSSSSIDHLLILCNYIQGMITDNNNNNTISFLSISNNYISNYNTSISLHETTSGVLLNNVITSSVYLYNFQIQNNIQIDGNMSLNNNTFMNNIGNKEQFPIENNKKRNVNMNDVFVKSDVTSTDGKWQLKSDSPAIGAGYDKTDCGMFGGSTPYVLSGMPAIPAIYELSMPATGNDVDGIKVTIKAIAH